MRRAGDHVGRAVPGRPSGRAAPRRPAVTCSATPALLGQLAQPPRLGVVGQLVGRRPTGDHQFGVADQPHRPDQVLLAVPGGEPADGEDAGPLVPGCRLAVGVELLDVHAGRHHRHRGALQPHPGQLVDLVVALGHGHVDRPGQRPLQRDPLARPGVAGGPGGAAARRRASGRSAPPGCRSRRTACAAARPADPVVPVHHLGPPVAGPPLGQPAAELRHVRDQLGGGQRAGRADRHPLHPVAVDVSIGRRQGRVVAALVDPDVVAPPGQLGGDPRDVLVGADGGPSACRDGPACAQTRPTRMVHLHAISRAVVLPVRASH